MAGESVARPCCFGFIEYQDMEIIYQGTKYSNVMRQAGNIAFASKPYVVLYSPTTKKWFGSNLMPNKSGEVMYEFEFSAAITKNMPVGVYNLEIYSDSTRTDMMKRMDNYAKVVSSASSPDSIVSTSN